MSLLQITNLWPPFTGADLEDTAPFVPVIHYHTLEGPSKQIKQLVGPSKALRALEGPSKQVRILKGSD